MKLLKDIRYKFPILIIFLFINLSLFAQKKEIYVKAFDCIKAKNKGQKLIVADSIIHLDFSNFLSELSSEWGKKPSTVIKMLDRVDHAQEDYKLSREELRSLGVHGYEPTQIIYFSNFYNNMLIIEIMDKTKSDNLSHHIQSKFNQSKQYLFLFDNRNKIKKVFQKTIQYD